MFCIEILMYMETNDRLLDLIEHPERYSDREIEALLSDPEISRMLSALGKTRSALTTPETPDVEAELAAFHRQHPRHPRLVRVFGRRPAVAAATVAAISFAAVAAIVGVKVSMNSDARPAEAMGSQSETVVEATVSSAVTEPDSTLAVAPADEAITVFENATLESIVREIASYYNLAPEFRSARAKKLRLYFRWDRSMTAEETVDLLNSFDRIKIKINNGVITVN